MVNRFFTPIIFTLLVFIAAVMSIKGVSTAETSLPLAVTPAQSILVHPTPTLSLGERLRILEIQVSSLNKNSAVSSAKDFFDIVQSVATVVAFIVGAIWSYLLFVQNRQKYPRAHISHSILHKSISDGKKLLHVAVIIANKGSVLLSLVSLETRIQQVIPPPENVLDLIKKDLDPVSEGQSEIEWSLLDSRESNWKEGTYEVEPGEEHEFHYDFILDANVETVEIYTFLRNEKKRGRDIGWYLTTLYDLSGPK